MNPRPIFIVCILFSCFHIVAQVVDSNDKNQQQTVTIDNHYTTNQTSNIQNSLNVNKSHPLAKATGTFEDLRDGKEYKWVQIDKQIWMAQNLAFLPVGSLPEKDCEYWVYGDIKRDLTKIKHSEMFNNKGVLYNYKAATKACPPGWRLPMDYDWLKLEAFLGIDRELLMIEGPRGEVANKLKSDSAWSFYDKELNMTGFTAIPSGFYDEDKKTFFEIRASVTYWSLEIGHDKILCRNLLGNKNKTDRVNCDRENGYSVRCIKK